jgi:hypothetical protein
MDFGGVHANVSNCHPVSENTADLDGVAVDDADDLDRSLGLGYFTPGHVLGDLLLPRPWLPIQAVLIVGASRAVTDVTANIGSAIRGAGVPAVAAGAVGLCRTPA